MARVILCDDSPLILRVLERQLTNAGYQVVGKASDGNQCLDIFKSHKADLILLDITMPNKDGRETLAEILVLDPQANVVMISAIADQAVQEECLKLGAKAFVSKSNIGSEEEFRVNVLHILQTLSAKSAA